MRGLTIAWQRAAVSLALAPALASMACRGSVAEADRSGVDAAARDTADSGEPGGDSGPTVADVGTVPPVDTGSAPPEAGAPPDSAPPPADTAVPPPTSDIDPSCTPPAVDPSCSTGARSVASEDDVLAVITTLPQQFLDPKRTSTLTSSDDLVASATIELDAAKLPTCTFGCAPPSYRTSSRFGPPGEPPPVAGVTCLLPAGPTATSWHCDHVRIEAGTTFRLRAVVEDHHPEVSPNWPVFDLVPGCAAACPVGSVRCGATQTCMPEHSYCTFCQGLTAPECACRTGACRLAPEGSTCHYDAAADVAASGVCTANHCK